jgi:hypothetical protein
VLVSPLFVFKELLVLPVLLLFLGSLVGVHVAVATAGGDADPLGPLSAEQGTALETAIDDRDHQESAFAALMSAMNSIDPETLKSATLEPWGSAQTDAVLGAPDAWRGRPFELTGRLEQSERLERPWSPFVEWFLRLPDGSAAAIYLPQSEDREPGERVRVAARFYKRISARARDGTLRTYPAFGGRIRPIAVAVTPDRLIIIGIVLLVLGWVLVSLFTGGRGRSGQRKATSVVASKAGEPTSLPADPVDALDELARRHDDRQRKKGDP